MFSYVIHNQVKEKMVMTGQKKATQVYNHEVIDFIDMTSILTS